MIAPAPKAPLIVLAFDIAGRTGWACSDPKVEQGVVWGSFGLGPLDGEAGIGAALFDFHNHVYHIMIDREVTCLAWEKPIRASKHSAAFDEFQKAAIGHLRVNAFMGDLVMLPCDMKAVRKHFIGQGTGDAKRQVFQRCLTLGYQVKNDDQSDAIATWDYAVGIMKARAYAGSSKSFGGSGGGAFAAPRRAGGHRRL